MFGINTIVYVKCSRILICREPWLNKICAQIFQHAYHKSFHFGNLISKFNFTTINQCFTRKFDEGYGLCNIYVLIEVAHPSKWCMGDHCRYSLLSGFDCISTYGKKRTWIEYAVTVSNTKQEWTANRGIGIRDPSETIKFVFIWLIVSKYKRNTAGIFRLRYKSVHNAESHDGLTDWLVSVQLARISYISQ